MDDPRIDVARKLFAAWSSGDADAPAPYMNDDAVLYDIVGGEHKGWPAIRDFFAHGLVRWPDLVLEPERFWVSDDGVALSWLMSATVTDDTFGPEAKGKKWRSEGMTYLIFDGLKVAREVDYHDGGAPARSLGVAKSGS
jgi:ketosteroid isomerase-like protein